MSMKFLTGLQDLLGLYETGTAASSPASPIPPTSPAMFATPPQQQSHSAATSVRKKTREEANSSTDDPDSDTRIRQCSHARTVSFPADIDLITGYHEAPSSLFHSSFGSQRTIDPAEILACYREACNRRQCVPSPGVEKQIGYFHKNAETRQEMLSLKGERVSHAQMEALEEIFKRVQFTTIDFEYTFLDDESAISLGEMIEFYDSCVRLNLSFNKQIDMRGWMTIFRAVRNAISLQMLNLRYTTLNDRSIPSLCKMARAQPSATLTCLHLENTQMSGKNLLVLICALKNNTGLRELYLGDNGLQPTDGSHIFQLITSNSGIQLLDLRNNNLGDSGVRHICDGLRHRESIEKSSLSAMVLWNNSVTYASMDSLADALAENTKIETLNIGNNALGVEGIARLKSALVSNSHLHRLGLQNTGINCEGAIILAECIADNSALLRVDIRDNPIALAGLLALHSAMKMNKSITLLNIDATCVKMSSEKVREYQDEFERYFREIQTYCDRNKDEVLKRLTVTFDDEEGGSENKEKVNKAVEENKEESATESNEAVNPESPSDSSETESPVEKSSNTESNNNEKRLLMPSSSTSKLSRRERHQRFVRSSSLTCTETVHDIHDRLREMSGSTHSLDATVAASLSSSLLSPSPSLHGNPATPLDSSSNSESMKTIKKSFTVSTTSPASLPLAEWGSLPALPQASPTATPVVRKLRRFSVSPSSSVFDVATTSSASVAASASSSSIPEVTSTLPTRPSTLAIGIPLAGTVPPGPSSAPLILVEEHQSKIISPGEPRSSSTSSSTGTSTNVEQQKEEGDIRETCQAVICDLLNYVEYEEKAQVERKASLLLRNAFNRPNPEELLRNLKQSESSAAGTPRTPLTPSRVLEIAEELEGETDEQVCKSVLRCLIRDVLQAEKNELRSTLDRRRRHTSVRNSPV